MEKIADTRIEAISASFPQLKSTRMAWFMEPPANDASPSVPVLIAEFHGAKVDDVRQLRYDVSKALAEMGAPSEVEIVRSDWLPLGPDGQVDFSEISNRYASAISAKKCSAIEDGSFAVLPEKAKDSFRYFGSHSKIRTPCELSYPCCISLGNWVSLGRYGKIVMLPEAAFDASCETLARTHYPELAGTFDFTGWNGDRTADLYLGDGTTLGDRYFIICTKSVEFGKHVMSASDLFVSDCHHQFEEVELPPALLPPTKGKPVLIGDHVWIGIRCSILEGVTIGRHAVVAAHSVVKEDIPPYSLAAGIPAKIQRQFPPKSSKFYNAHH